MMFLVRNFIRALLMLVFFLALLVSTLCYRLLDKEFLFTAFEEAELYENLPEILVDQLMKALLPGIFSFWLTIGLVIFGIGALTKKQKRLSQANK